MSIAASFVNSIKTTKNKELVRRHMVAKSKVEPFGEDKIHRFCDGSSLIDRKIVNEWQVFKS
ncbi:MAG TPA: hypothetical protein VIC51_01265 [Psychromonas sp.]